MKKETYIYGLRPVIEAIKSGKEFEKVMLQKNLKGEIFRELFALIKETEIPFQFVPVEKLNHLSRQNHQGVIGFVSEITYQKAEDLVPAVFERGQTPLFLILDRITDVRNFGSIVRTAECAGAHGVIIPAKGSASINSDAIKTSAGALYKLPVVRSNNLKDTIRFFRESGLKIIAATEKSDLNYSKTDLTGPFALIMGSEGEGIAEEYLRMTDVTVQIPLFGEIESLNVSVATGVILFEAMRQREQ
ncbi:MAG TPA: 23S rRNA (guanosine(2251)-2'-O)-methyltransferase RlmB [Bacteroidales bacterium]|nr:23S rRNA (guanosine(2251)-2'-O)-methyltransferase RlmB [Bacteroidales bacterium]HPS50982.1 23S rRNA (guanosine(2251)-2'-O)-methyltransferase RlmB [Bacteroidales bacterium]